MLKYVVTMCAFMFVVPITVHVTSFILRTIDSFIRMYESIEILEKQVNNLTMSIDEIYDVIQEHGNCLTQNEDTLNNHQKQFADNISKTAYILQNIDDLYEAINIVADRILEEAAKTKHLVNIKVEEQPKVNKLETDNDSPSLLQRSIIRRENRETFEHFIADCIRFRSEGKTTKEQLLRAFRKWFWSENTEPICTIPSDHQVLECMYHKFGYAIDEWKGIIFV